MASGGSSSSSRVLSHQSSNTLPSNNYSSEYNSYSTQQRFKVEVRCQAMKNTLGLFDHYFIVINNVEYHMGYYSKGAILPVNSTKGWHLVTVKEVCADCYQKIIETFCLGEDKRLFSFYPFINCETLTTGFSVQSLIFLLIPISTYLVYYKLYNILIYVILITICLILAYSKYVFSRTNYLRCKHLYIT